MKLLALMISFGKIGFTALGGGHSMLKLMQYEAVTSRHWLSETDFATMLGSTFLFPGLTAVKLSALIGYQVAGLLGLLVSVLALNLPGLLLSFIGYRLLVNWHSAVADKLMIVVQYGALALLASAAFALSQGVLKLQFSLGLFILTIAFFVLLSLFELSPFWGLIAFIIVGFGWLTIYP